MSEISLKAINDLKGYEFVVDSYQRGYRWESKQVKKLLDDLLEFSEKEEGYYCLQPLIVRKISENKYELIDGQQRLTTLYILLKYLNKEIYEIEYKTRIGSKEFLQNIKEIKEKKEELKNMDYYFMKNAYDTIKDWFEKISTEKKDDALDNEFATLIVGKNHLVRFIWYEVEADENMTSEEIFTRINVGKIPLTDAELIKSKLLFNAKIENSEEQYLKQLEIGNEWDSIEKDLQNNNFWRFLVNTKDENINRIEYIFDYISGKNNNEEEYYTFETIDKMLKDENNNIFKKEKIFWDTKVKSCYRIFKEWYNDIELYNYIGFLNFYSNRTYKLLEEYFDFLEKHSDKQEFKKHVKDLIIKEIGNIELEELTYGEDDDKIKKILILFNIITMNKISQRFPFEKCRKKDWSIEHIHPRNIKKFGNDKEKWKQWCEDEYITIQDFINEFSSRGDKKENKYKIILEKINNMRINIDKKSDDELQAELQIITELMEEEYGVDNINNIANLTLLDKDSNSLIGNNFFDTKRKKIIEIEKEGGYIPVCTKNVFLKFYSKNPNHIYFWTDEDRKEYKEELIKTLNGFLRNGDINDTK